MLIQFSVKNFMSFKEKAVLALNPSSDVEHPENVNEMDGYKALNLIAIYGANASGMVNNMNIRHNNCDKRDHKNYNAKFDGMTEAEKEECSFHLLLGIRMELWLIE